MWNSYDDMSQITGEYPGLSHYQRCFCEKSHDTTAVGIPWEAPLARSPAMPMAPMVPAVSMQMVPAAQRCALLVGLVVWCQSVFALPPRLRYKENHITWQTLKINLYGTKNTHWLTSSLLVVKGCSHWIIVHRRIGGSNAELSGSTVRHQIWRASDQLISFEWFSKSTMSQDESKCLATSAWGILACHTHRMVNLHCCWFESCVMLSSLLHIFANEKAGASVASASQMMALASSCTVKRAHVQKNLKFQ